MRFDYKFWYIKRDDDGWITEAAIRLYEGEYQDVTIKSPIPGVGDIVVNKYVRTKRLGGGSLDTIIGRKIKAELSGQPTFVYTRKDFGMIKTDVELKEFLDKQMASEKSREPITEQKCLA